MSDNHPRRPYGYEPLGRRALDDSASQRGPWPPLMPELAPGADVRPLVRHHRREAWWCGLLFGVAIGYALAVLLA